MKKYLWLGLIALPVMMLDVSTKFWLLGELTTAYATAPTLSEKAAVFFGDAPAPLPHGHHYSQRRAITVLEQYFRIRYTENPGAAFGLFHSLPENIRGPLFHLVSLGALLLVAFYLRGLTGKREEFWVLGGLSCVLGGALGNYTDRLARGFVIDFLEFHWHDQIAWPSFNVADIAICVGAGMLLVDSFIRREPTVAKEAKE